MENESCYDWIVRHNFPDADFWLINKSSEGKLGQPTKEFEPFLTGIKCHALILPDYGFYLCLYFHNSGLGKQYSVACRTRSAISSTNLKSLRITTITEIFKDISCQHRIQTQTRFKTFVPAKIPEQRQAFYASL